MRSAILAIIAVAAQAMSLEGQDKQAAVATTKTNSLAQASASAAKCWYRLTNAQKKAKDPVRYKRYLAKRAARVAAWRARMKAGRAKAAAARKSKAKAQETKAVNKSFKGVNAKLDDLIRKVVALRGGKAIPDIKAAPKRDVPMPRPSPKPKGRKPKQPHGRQPSGTKKNKRGSPKPVKASANGLFKTGLPSNVVTPLDKDIWAAQNKLRADPAYFIKYLEKEKKCFAPGSLINTCGSIRLRTQEGVPAIDEAIKALKNQKALKPMKWADGLFLSVRDHCRDQGSTGKTGHSGSDGSSPFDRIARYGKWSRTAGENISYGSKTGDSIIMQLFVDDGVASRGHRHNLQKAAFGVTGICTGKHSRYRTMCTLIYSGAGYTLGAAGKAEIKKLGGTVV